MIIIDFYNGRESVIWWCKGNNALITSPACNCSSHLSNRLSPYLFFMNYKNEGQAQTKNEQIELLEFKFNSNNQNVHIELINNEPWFIAKDVCDILELDNVTKALYPLDDDEKLTLPVVRSGQTREMNFVNESGLYSLIFQSRKPEAKKFKKWVTSEVLPSIRKTGGYNMGIAPAPQQSIEYYFANRLKSCTKIEHEGSIYYAANQLCRLAGRGSSGSYSNILRDKLGKTGQAIKIGEDRNSKWFVREDAIGILLGIKPNTNDAVTIVNLLNKGGI